MSWMVVLVPIVVFTMLWTRRWYAPLGKVVRNETKVAVVDMMLIERTSITVSLAAAAVPCISSTVETEVENVNAKSTPFAWTISQVRPRFRIESKLV
ncbi:hypothetical protein B0H13DRAFT_1993275 [Mycena leptocephala]|nr:hypothetical protein B0H13DRAFT_1993275 [Mycena leptocephala]